MTSFSTTSSRIPDSHTYMTRSHSTFLRLAVLLATRLIRLGDWLDAWTWQKSMRTQGPCESLIISFADGQTLLVTKLPHNHQCTRLQVISTASIPHSPIWKWFGAGSLNTRSR